MRKLSRKELIQTNVDIIKDIHIFCQKNEICYSLGYGTLLGAVRHKGFIPWDDDADIIMPRPDYDRFIELYKSDKYTLLSCKRNDYYLPFARVSDETTYKEETTTTWKATGVAVDIYPIDGKNYYGDNSLEAQIALYKTLIRIKGTIAWKHDRGLVKNVIMIILKLAIKPLGLSLLCKKFDKIARKYSYNSSEYVGSYMSPYGRRDMFAKTCFDSYVYLQFESEHFMCISTFDKYLSNIYGDYMILPPIENRVSTHDAEFFKK